MSENNEQTPVATSEFTRPEFLTNTRFDSFDLPPSLLAGLDDAGFKYCTPIQAAVLPVSLTGKDVAGQAQTGTGKTAAFLVTIFTRLLRMNDRKPGLPGAMIVAPTRELALQVYDDAQLIGRHTGLTMGLAIGGVGYDEQADTIKNGADLIICTPGRIIDYLKQGVFKPSDIKLVVIDEADRLFDLGFVKDLRYLLRKMPHYEKRQSMLFSATLSYRVLELTYEYMNLPEFIDVAPQEITVDRIDQSLIHVGWDEKFSLLLGILEREDWNRVLIFVNTKAGVEWVAKKLKGNGLPAEGITGDLPQRKRFQLMERYKNGQIKILVATDVASRGIHVEDISHVINYDLPQDIENYVHRIGRTARAGHEGRAISLACEEYVFHLEPLQEYLGYNIPVAWPEEGWFKADEAGEVRIDRRGKPRKPAPSRSQRTSSKKDKEKDREPQTKPVALARPHGIFGLAPAWRTEALEGQTASDNGGAKKKKRRRRKKKPAGSDQTNQNQNQAQSSESGGSAAESS
jgi:ATP-dependent RNA helicase RhlB